MGKKKGSALGFLYLIGMALAVIGFFLPMFKGLFGSTANGFSFVKNIDDGGFAAIGALIMFIGAVAGLCWSLLPMIGIKLPAANLVKMLAVLALVVGVVVLIVGFTQSKVYSAVAKHLLKNAMYGFYVLIAGIVLAVVGKLTNK